MENKPPREADAPQEVLDIVDENDNVIGSKTRKEIYAKGLRNFRVVHAFIMNSEGKLWIPVRSESKKLYPNGLDFSIAGHVESGESYDEAIQKEALEEVGLNLNDIEYKEIGYFTPHTHEVHCFQKVYLITSDETPRYNSEDFSGYEWLAPREVIEKFESGATGKDDIPEVIRLCLLS